MTNTQPARRGWEERYLDRACGPGEGQGPDARKESVWTGRSTGSQLCQGEGGVGTVFIPVTGISTLCGGGGRLRDGENNQS